MKLTDLSKPKGLQSLDNYLISHSFISGVEPTQADFQVFSAVKPGLIRPYVNISRWFANISSFGAESKNFPASDTSIEIEPDEPEPVTEVAESGFQALHAIFNLN